MLALWMGYRYTARMETEGHRKLREYLDSGHDNAAALARKANIKPMQLSHLVNGRRRASFAVAFAIEEATGGVVKARDWLHE